MTVRYGRQVISSGKPDNFIFSAMRRWKGQPGLPIVACWNDQIRKGIAR